MQTHRHPHHIAFRIAFRAVVLAIGLPTVIFMFLSIRTRQLQSTANPRWAQFSKVTGPKAFVAPATSESSKVSIRTVSVRSDEPSTFESNRQSFSQPNYSGSVTGIDSIEYAVRSKLRPATNPDSRTDLNNHPRERDVPQEECRPPAAVNVLPKDLTSEITELASRIATSTGRVEAQIDEVRQRLDLLAIDQREQQRKDSTREAELLNAVNSFHELMADAISQNKTRTSATVATEFHDKEVLTATDSEPVPPVTKPISNERIVETAEVAKSTTAQSALPESMTLVTQVEKANEFKGVESRAPLRTFPFLDDQHLTDRQFLARLYHERAIRSFDRGDYVKARQQAEASLHQNKDDLEVIRLRNEILQSKSPRGLR